MYKYYSHPFRIGFLHFGFKVVFTFPTSHHLLLKENCIQFVYMIYILHIQHKDIKKQNKANLPILKMSLFLKLPHGFIQKARGGH